VSTRGLERKPQPTDSNPFLLPKLLKIASADLPLESRLLL